MWTRRKNRTSSSSLRAAGMKRFKKNIPARVALYVLIFFALIALMAPLIANEKPIYCKIEGIRIYPALSFKNNYTIITASGDTLRIQPDIANWKQMQFEKVLWPPVPYSPGKLDRLNSGYKGPGDAQLFSDASGNIVTMPKRFRHRLGTGNLGEDVFAGLVHGARISLTIGFCSMAIASLLGLLFGSMAGYYGNNRLMLSRTQLWAGMIGLIPGWFYGFHIRQFILQDALAHSGLLLLFHLLLSFIILAGVVTLFGLIGKYLAWIPGLQKRIYVPVDSIISRSIEVLHSLPTFIVILTIAAIARPSLVNVMIIIGLTSWTGIARLTRAELMRIRELEYIHAARALGFSNLRIILQHALPNGIAPALVSIAFGIASAILVESGLSFLGIGVPADIVTWGSLVNDGRQQFSAWWLVIFPGLAIFITVTAYNLIGEGLRDAFDPHHQQ